MPDRAGQPLRLLAFHHAGGSAALFTEWRHRLVPRIEIVPVTLPGRGSHGWSRRFADLHALVEVLADELDPLLAEPHAFYGHSMGAMVAFQLTRLREEQGRRPPERLLVGAFAAPHRAHALRRVRGLTDAELVEWLVSASASPELLAAYLAGTRRRDAILARVREDLRLCAQEHFTRPPERPPLSCPIEVFHGTDDPLVPGGDAGEWSSYSTAGCRVHVIPGGHFFPRESREQFFEALHDAVQV
jgi:surfactin synthase thioesterase subunit